MTDPHFVPQINFQPWRQARRAEATQQFAIYAVLVIAAAALIVFLAGTVVSVSVSSQESRNAEINSQIRLLEKQLASISNLQKDRDDMLERMKIIQDLQGNRPVSVRIFDELVRVLPDAVFFNSLSMTGTQIFIKGVSESNAQVSTLMRNIDNSDWFTAPNLEGIKANRAFGDYASDFELSLTVTRPTVAKGQSDER